MFGLGGEFVLSHFGNFSSDAVFELHMQIMHRLLVVNGDECSVNDDFSCYNILLRHL